MYLAFCTISALTSLISSSVIVQDREGSQCPADWVHAQTEGCFKFLSSDTNISWLDAQSACEREGGYLAEPKTLGQMEFLAGIAALEESFYGIKFWWIGLDDIGLEGVWTWQHSRHEAAEDFWGEGSPSDQPGNNLDCAYVQLTEGRLDWEDDECKISSIDNFQIAPLCQRNTPDSASSSSSPEWTTISSVPTSAPTSTPEWTTISSVPTSVSTSIPSSSSWSSPTTGLPTTTSTLSGCQDGWSEFEGNCFLLVDDVMSWVRAKEKCHSLGADLLSIHSDAEKDFIEQLKNSFDQDNNYNFYNYWMGGTDSHSEGNWSWTDGSPWNYEFWKYYNGGVARNCVIMNGDNWRDINCAIKNRVVCKSNKN